VSLGLGCVPGLLDTGFVGWLCVHADWWWVFFFFSYVLYVCMDRVDSRVLIYVWYGMVWYVSLKKLCVPLVILWESSNSKATVPFLFPCVLA
jgi:hypothetical protein